jgi:hypothetical protein
LVVLGQIHLDLGRVAQELVILELSPSKALDKRIFSTWYVIHLTLAGVK